MAYHIRHISTGHYYTGNLSKPWESNAEGAEEYQTKTEAKIARRDFVHINQLYYSRKSIHVTKLVE